MRRSRGGFAWVSMMDLLFGLFGALVILTVLITLKLASSAGVDLKPFNLIMLEARSETRSPEVESALERMNLGFRLFDETGAKLCDFSSSSNSSACESQLAARFENAQVKFRTGAEAASDAPLAAVLFVGGSGTGLQVEARLNDVANFRDIMPADRIQQTLVLRLSVKSGALFWEPAFCLPLSDILSRAETDSLGAASLPFFDMPICPPAIDPPAPGPMQVGGRLVLR